MYYTSHLEENNIFIICYIYDWCTCYHSEKIVNKFLAPLSGTYVPIQRDFAFIILLDFNLCYFHFSFYFHFLTLLYILLYL